LPTKYFLTPVTEEMLEPGSNMGLSWHGKYYIQNVIFGPLQISGGKIGYLVNGVRLSIWQIKLHKIIPDR
jgi:hypothetical protein